MRRPRLGLVLSGGGVYGAFQAGFLDAVFEAGHRFPVIAGTSIGAFNGALASRADARELRRFWLRMPRRLQREALLAQKQWRACLASFCAVGRQAEAVGREAGLWRAGAAGGGGALLAGGGTLLVLGTGGVGLSVGALAAAGAALLGVSHGVAHGHAVGTRWAHRRLGEIIREREDAEPILKPRTVDLLRSRVARASRRTEVLATLTRRGAPFTARHLVAMKDSRDSEVLNEVVYADIHRGATDDVVIASMSIPFLFGRNNAVNPSSHFDGGLADNVPAHALAKRVHAGELDALLVIDVSEGPNSFRQRIWGPLHEVPVFYVHLASRSGLASILDFKRAPSLYARGKATGRRAVRAWLEGGQWREQIEAYYDTSSELPAGNVLRG